MKKRILIVLLVVIAALDTNATHLMGGDIGVSKDFNGNYILEHINFRDTLGIPAYTATDFNCYKWDAMASAWVAITNPPGMTLNMPLDVVNSGGLLVGMPYGVEFYKYRSDPGLLDSIFNLNGTGKYLFFAEECCRNNAILNMSNPGGESLVISCEYTYDPTPATSEQSPEFLAIPIMYGPVNTAWVYNPLPFDSDGDSLVWSLNTPYGSWSSATLNPCAGFTTPPSTLAGPLSLNSVTGQVDWTPNTVGNFVASFEIKEYSGGVEIGSVIRDMQYIVVPDSVPNRRNAVPEFASVSNTESNTQDNYLFYNYYHNQPLSFTVAAHDFVNPTDVLTMQAFSELLNNNSNANFAYSATGIGNTVNGTFNWTPNVNDTKDYILVIRANDGTFSKDFTVVLRHNPGSPTSVLDFENQLNITAYPNPVPSNQSVLFNVETPSNIQNMVLEVVDLSGKLITNQSLNNLSSGTNAISLNKQLKAGFYMASFIDQKNGKRQIVKFVVQ